MARMVEYRRGAYTLSTDPERLDLDTIHRFLQQSYWAAERPVEVIRKSIANSLCFGVYNGAEQVGFARVVTDYATFGWLCDVFVDPAHRGRGLGKWLVESVVAHEELATVRTMILGTRDAHELYARYGGFGPLPSPEKMMVRRRG